MSHERTEIEKLQKEREHLEKLFSDRINFYLVFAAALLIFLVDKDPADEKARPVIICVFFISAVMLLALVRTFRLVKRVLDRIKHEHTHEVYSEIARAVHFPRNANEYLVAVPVILFVYCGVAFVRSMFPLVLSKLH